jgi:hypothetical protein
MSQQEISVLPPSPRQRPIIAPTPHRACPCLPPPIAAPRRSPGISLRPSSPRQRPGGSRVAPRRGSVRSTGTRPGVKNFQLSVFCPSRLVPAPAPRRQPGGTAKRIGINPQVLAPGMKFFNMPLFPWSIYATAWIQLLATPVVGITLIMLIAERLFFSGSLE